MDTGESIVSSTTDTDTSNVTINGYDESLREANDNNNRYYVMEIPVVNGMLDQSLTSENASTVIKRFPLPVSHFRAPRFNLNESVLDVIFRIREETFKYYFHVTQETCIEIIQHIVGPNYQYITSSQKAHVIYSFLISFHYFCTEDYDFKFLSEHQDLPAFKQLNQPFQVAKGIVLDMARFIQIFTSKNFIYFESSNRKLLRMEKKFQEKYNIKRTIGCLDCMHVSIHSVQGQRSRTLINRKRYESLNIELICDADLIFKSVRAFYGSTHDHHTFNTSLIQKSLMQRFKQNNMKKDKICWFLADEAYALETFLMTPFDDVTKSAEATFNQVHAKVFDSTIRRAIELVRSQFRCLLRHRPIDYHYKSATYIVRSCFCLYNIMRKLKVIDLDMTVFEVDDMCEKVNDYKSRDSHIPKDCPFTVALRNEYAEKLEILKEKNASLIN